MTMDKITEIKDIQHKNNTTFDPDKRIETNSNQTINEKFDPDRRMKNEVQAHYIRTRGETSEGELHPITGVPYLRKTVEMPNGERIEGVFPKFESEFDATIPTEMYLEKDQKQFNECNKQLRNAITNNPKLANKFDREQLQQIENGETPDGYVWHHNEECGKFQLVDADIHAKTGHTGGKFLWGGGKENK